MAMHRSAFPGLVLAVLLAACVSTAGSREITQPSGPADIVASEALLEISDLPGNWELGRPLTFTAVDEDVPEPCLELRSLDEAFGPADAAWQIGFKSFDPQEDLALTNFTLVWLDSGIAQPRMLQAAPLRRECAEEAIDRAWRSDLQHGDVLGTTSEQLPSADFGEVIHRGFRVITIFEEAGLEVPIYHDIHYLAAETVISVVDTLRVAVALDTETVSTILSAAAKRATGE